MGEDSESINVVDFKDIPILHNKNNNKMAVLKIRY